MIVSIHQPNFLPWLGYFYKIAKSDIFVLLDDVQYSKNSFINRNRIKTPQGEMWLTLPVIQSGNFGQNIVDCIILRKEASVKKLLNSIKLNYAKAPYFRKYYDELVYVMQSKTEHLAELNTELIKWACNCLHIDTPLVTSSSLSIPQKQSTERLIQICKALDGTAYLCGKGGTKYQDEAMFAANDIKVTTSSFNHPVYHQQWGTFLPELSVIDLLFNEGDNSMNIIMDSDRILTMA
jgi:hypothetical protein